VISSDIAQMMSDYSTFLGADFASPIGLFIGRLEGIERRAQNWG